MIRAAALALVLGGAAPALAQQQEVSSATGAVLRALDKVNGETVDIEMPVGTIESFGRLKITLMECRYPVGNPAGNAFASLEISETGHEGTVFSGWMIAAAPALSAMDHARYDVWVMRCTTS